MPFPKMTTTKIQPAPIEEISISGISHPSILSYFATFNVGEFQATADLFAENGTLKPPFEDPVVGTQKIAGYLETEAKGMQLFPKEGIITPLEDGNKQFQVGGRVQTPWFGVNVSWLFVVNSAQEIVSATIKLLASPQELLKMRQSQNG